MREFVTRDQIFSCTCCKYNNQSIHASFVHTNCSELLLSAKFPFWEFLNLNLLRFTVCRKSDSKSLHFYLKRHRPNVFHSWCRGGKSFRVRPSIICFRPVARFFYGEVQSKEEADQTRTEEQVSRGN